MNKYKIEFRGYAYVEADSEEEAKEKFYDDDFIYKDDVIDNTEQVWAIDMEMNGKKYTPMEDVEP